MVKNILTNQEMKAQSLGQEDPLVMKMATHSRILAREIVWILQATVHTVLKESVTTW